MKKILTLGDKIGLVVVGLTLGCGSIGAAAISADWCYSEYQFSLDRIEGKGRVVDLEKHKLRTSPRRRTYFTSDTLIVDSEHGKLEISADPVPIGSTVHYDYSPSQQAARLHGESMFWWTLLFVFLGLGGGVTSLVGTFLIYKHESDHMPPSIQAYSNKKPGKRNHTREF